MAASSNSKSMSSCTCARNSINDRTARPLCVSPNLYMRGSRRTCGSPSRQEPCFSKSIAMYVSPATRLRSSLTSALTRRPAVSRKPPHPQAGAPSSSSREYSGYEGETNPELYAIHLTQGRSTQIISTIQWIRTSRLSIKNYVSSPDALWSVAPAATNAPQGRYHAGRDWTGFVPAT